MANPSRITDFSVTAANNSPAGNDNIGTNADDLLRAIQATTRGDLAHKGADIASASTTDLGAVQGLMHDITGTTTITSFGTVAAGVWKILKFEGALTLTHNASIILPGGENITTADGDVGIFISEGSGNWRCVSYFKAATGGLVSDASDSNKGVIEIAASSEVEAASSTTLAVTPGRLHSHPGVAKGRLVADTVGTIINAYNVASIIDAGVGNLTVMWDNDFVNANYTCVVTPEEVANNLAIRTASFAAGSLSVITYVSTTGAAEDPNRFHVVAFGAQP